MWVITKRVWKHYQIYWPGPHQIYAYFQNKSHRVCIVLSKGCVVPNMICYCVNTSHGSISLRIKSSILMLAGSYYVQMRDFYNVAQQIKCHALPEQWSLNHEPWAYQQAGCLFHAHFSIGWVDFEKTRFTSNNKRFQEVVESLIFYGTVVISKKRYICVFLWIDALAENATKRNKLILARLNALSF